MATPPLRTLLPADFSVPLIGPRAISSGAVTGAVAAIAVGARLGTKVFVTKAVGWDDCRCSGGVS